MNKHTIPAKVYLMWVASSGGYFALHTSPIDSNGYTLLGEADVDFGHVVFDEKSLTLKALNKELGEAQGKVNYIKEKIQELLAIGHDEPELGNYRPQPNQAPKNDFDPFEDDILF